MGLRECEDDEISVDGSHDQLSTSHRISENVSLCFRRIQSASSRVSVSRVLYTMSSRASLYPVNSTGQSAAALAKQRACGQLATRLSELSKRVESLDREVVTAGVHADKIRELACMHASL